MYRQKCLFPLRYYPQQKKKNVRIHLKNNFVSYIVAKILNLFLLFFKESRIRKNKKKETNYNILVI